MAITVPNVVKAVGSGVTSVTTSGVTTTTGSTFLIICSCGNGPTMTPSDSKGNTYTLIDNQVASGAQISGWYKTNGTGGAGHTATVSISGTEYPVLHFIELAGADAASFDATSVNSGTASGPYSLTSGTLAQADSLVVAWAASDAAGAQNYAASGYTVNRETDGDNYWTSANGYKQAGSTSAQTATWTGIGGVVAMGIAAFKAAAGGTDYDLTVDPASYALTAAAQTLQVARALTVSPSSHAVTAQPVDLVVGRGLSASPVSYAVSAQPVTLAATRALSIDPTSYSLANSAVTLSVGRAVSANAVPYALAASPIALVVSRVLSVAPAAYSLTAPDVTLDYQSVNKVLSVAPASYLLDLADVDLGVRRAAVEPIWAGPYGKKRKGGTESYLERLLGRPLDEVEEEIEPEAVEVIERAIESAPAKVTKTAAKRSLKEYGLAYKEAYVEIYLELAKRQRQEDEEVAAAIAAIL